MVFCGPVSFASGKPTNLLISFFRAKSPCFFASSVRLFLPTMPNKKNAYTYFVESRCRMENIAVPRGYTKFSSEWQDMGPEERNPYFKLADEAHKAQYAANDVIHLKPPPAALAKREAPGMVSLSTVSARQRACQNGDKPRNSEETMADIIPEARHGEVEYDMANGLRQASEDVATPTYQEIAAHTRSVILDEYKDMSALLMRKILVVSTVPVADGINRPLEIAVECSRLGLGFISSPYHVFVDPGQLPGGRRIDITDARRNRHKIPASVNQRTDDSDVIFHEGFTLISDYYELYKALVDVTEEAIPATGGKRHLPLLTSITDLGVTWACLEWLHRKALEAAERTGRPVLPSLKLATLHEFCLRIYFLKENNTPEEQERVAVTYKTRRWRNLASLKCNFHRSVDASDCACAIAGELMYSTFDIFRDEYHLPRDGAHVPVGWQEERTTKLARGMGDMKL